MTNVKVLHEIAVENGWVVRADTIRFGKQQIMCEGTYDDCIKYVMSAFRNPLVGSIIVTINGYAERYGVNFNNKTLIISRPRRAG